MDLVGQTLGDRYRVERFLGSGRFASVYAAVDARGGARVAVKVFEPSTELRTDVGDRYFRRARAAAQSLHPVVVPIIDSGRAPDRSPFLVMELLEGRTVEQDVALRGPFTLARGLFVATATLQGLAAAHAEGHVHRDVNASNVFLVDPEAAAPTVRLLDMGVARDLVDYLAIAPSSIGSTRYLAPEILVDADRAWTAGVDVFAAGMVLFFMLAGRLPFDPEAYGSGKNTINAFASLLELPPLSRFVPQVPTPIDAIVTKALAVEPSKRYRNASEMLVALERARSEMDSSALEDRTSTAGAFEGFASPFSADDHTAVSDAAPPAIDLYSPHVEPPPVDPSAVCDPTKPIELPEARPPSDDTGPTALSERAGSGPGDGDSLDLANADTLFGSAGADGPHDTLKAEPGLVRRMVEARRAASAGDGPGDDDEEETSVLPAGSASVPPPAVSSSAPAHSPAPPPPAAPGAERAREPPPATVAIAAPPGATRERNLLVPILLVAAAAFAAGVIATLVVVALVG